MGKDVSQKLSKVIQIDEDQIQQHLGDLVRDIVEDSNASFPHLTKLISHCNCDLILCCFVTTIAKVTAASAKASVVN